MDPVPHPPPKPSGRGGGFLVIIIVIVLIVAVGFYTIWRVVNRGKCSVPDKSNCGDESASDGYPKLPMCTDPDGTATCELQTKVCGNKPDCTGTLSCDYKSKKWTCSKSGNSPSTQYCTISNGTVNYPIFLNGTSTGSNTVTSNAIQYILNSFPGFGNGCVLSQCESNYVVTNGACVKKAIGDCPDPVYPVQSYAKGPNGCYVTACDNTGVGQYNVASGAQSCTLIKCDPGTTGAKYTPNGDICQPDCSDSATLNYFFTGSATTNDPRTSAPINYFTGQLDITKTKCVPTNNGDVWGGCGSENNPSYAYDNGTCQPTVSTSFARFDDGLGTGGDDSQPNSDAGCLLCEPKLCLPGTKDINKCYGDTLCGFSGIKTGNGTPEGAVAFCVSEKNDAYVFSPYQTGLLDRNRYTPGQKALAIGNIIFNYSGAGNYALSVIYRNTETIYKATNQYTNLTPAYQYTNVAETIELRFVRPDDALTWNKKSSPRYIYLGAIWNYVAQNTKGDSMDVVLGVDTGTSGWYCPGLFNLTITSTGASVLASSIVPAISNGNGPGTGC